eukprot:scaffold255186_cov29-Tisochrysis_lutea.AAC.1
MRERQEQQPKREILEGEREGREKETRERVEGREEGRRVEPSRFRRGRTPLDAAARRRPRQAEAIRGQTRAVDRSGFRHVRT